MFTHLLNAMTLVVRCLAPFSLLALAFGGSALAEQTPFSAVDDGAETPNYEEHIAELMRDACTSCHRGSRAKNGLQLTSLAKMLEGGSSGAALVPGDADGSLMFQVMMHVREPFMPKDEPRLDDEILTSLRVWINAGAPATATSGPTGGLALEAGPSMILEASGPPTTVAALPEGLRTEPLWWSPRGTAVMALAASPSLNLVAIGGHRQVSLYDPADGKILGVLAFPEGDIESLAFSRDGSLLIAAGGRGGESGRAVGWEVTTGSRVFELGDEPDAILSAELSSDHSLLALGGVDGILRVFSTADGTEVYASEKHADWVTAVSFSPDGVLLASADRAGGLFVWEALSGREFHTLESQKGSVNAITWRGDSQLLATGANDGAVRLFEMEEGKRVQGWSAHTGVLDLSFLPDGRLLSAGRDGRARLCDSNGKLEAEFNGAQSYASSCAATFDGRLLLVGDMSGIVRVHEVGQDAALRELQADPNTALELKALEARGAFVEQQSALGALRERLEAKGQAAQDAQNELEALARKSTELSEALTTARAAESEAKDQTAQARAAEEPAQVMLLSAAQGHEVLVAKFDVVARTASDRRAAAQAAVRARVAAERALQLAAEGEPQKRAKVELSRVTERCDGAMALAQLAEEDAAALALRKEIASLQRELWDEIAVPLAAITQRCDEAEMQAAEEARRLSGEASAALSLLEPAATRARELEVHRTELQPLIDAAVTLLEAERAEFAAAEAAWGEL
ncbi:MAG: hypothetical protein ACI9HE_003980, partial [Planctomycetota bacterium]